MFSITDILLDSVDPLDISLKERGYSLGLAIYGDPIADGDDIHLVPELPTHFPELFVGQKLV
ncbi:hypothetical protein SAMN02982931_03761 [Bauldia litoralis]|uniref:Uncharacterized protein n=1 Tax=Bauldia litoralis TaxID=665467 RepID=A0A1G6DTL6_9HYPH|nr:hypothetical protein SAMN02982931_03761 [Bauldia litoralis]